MLRERNRSKSGADAARRWRASGAIRRPSARRRPRRCRRWPRRMARRCAIMAATGPPVLFVPSLINPPNVLDMGERSLLRWLAGAGPPRAAARLGLAGPGPARDVGRRPCRADPAAADGGARRAGRPGRLLPRRDDGARRGAARARRAASRPSPRPGISTASRTSARASSRRLWAGAQPTVAGARPAADGGAAMRLLEPRPGPHRRQVRGLRRRSKAPRRATFVMLEDWANDGPPVAEAAAREMFEGLFRDDLPGTGRWQRRAARSIDPAVARHPAAQHRLDHRPHRPRRHRRRAPASGSISRSAMSAWWSARARARQLWEPLAAWLSRTAANC